MREAPVPWSPRPSCLLGLRRRSGIAGKKQMPFVAVPSALPPAPSRPRVSRSSKRSEVKSLYRTSGRLGAVFTQEGQRVQKDSGEEPMRADALRKPRSCRAQELARSVPKKMRGRKRTLSEISENRDEEKDLSETDSANDFPRSSF